jgi:fructosamine-3-kinase
MDEKTDIIKQIFLDYDSSLQIKTISRPINGYSNSVYFITFLNNSSLELVLKFIKPGDNTEVIFYQYTTNYFPVPKVLKSDSINRNYYISSKLSGLPLSQLLDSMTHEQRLETYRELGTFVGQLHSKYTYERCGYLQDQSFHKWKDMFSNIIEKQIAQFKRTMFEELGDTIYKYLIDNMHLIDYDIVPRLLHMDLHCGNILMLNTKITGILDAEDALIGHNEYELMRIEKGHFEENGSDDYRDQFLSNYTNYVKLDDGYEERRRLYSLSRELVGMKCLMIYREQYAHF